MSTFDQFVSEIQLTLQGYGLAQPRASFLQSSVDADDLQFTVNDATIFEQGIAEIENELVFIESVDTGSNVLTISPDGRGYSGTAAASHGSGSRITMAPVWSRNRIASAINETIIGTYPHLFTVASTSFTMNPSISTYSLPTTVRRILQVVTDTIGPSHEQVEIKRYRLNATASGSNFPNGKSITLEKGGWPGRTIYVTYEASPSEITWGDDFTDSGLNESAKLCIKYGACSNLTAYMDTSRLPVDTAQADEFDATKNAVGTAARISTQLYQRYLMELERERMTLRTTAPLPVTVRTR